MVSSLEAVAPPTLPPSSTFCAVDALVNTLSISGVRWIFRQSGLYTARSSLAPMARPSQVLPRSPRRQRGLGRLDDRRLT